MSRPQIPGAGIPSPVPSKDAPLYEAIKPAFVNGKLYMVGEQFRSAEKPGRQWRLIDAGKPAAAPAPAGKRLRAEPAAAAPEGDTGRAADQSPI